MSRKDKLKFVVNHDSRNVSAIDPKGKEVGFVNLEKYGDAAKKNEVFQMGVKPAWQRMGLMSDLHNEAEKHFGTINPSRNLTDDGFAFWKSWRPEAVKDRYRFHRDKFLGLPAPTKSGQGVISSVGDKNMIATLPNGNTSMVNPDHADQLFQAAQQDQDQPITKADGGDVDGITAYHGSPHDFDQFDTSKIGTGEGAQSYGHGLYFAGHEPVAKGYRDALSGDPISQEGVKPDWRDRGSKSFAQLALAQSMDKKLSGDDAIHDAMQDLHKNAGLTERKDIKQRYYDAVNSLGQMLGKEWDIHKGHMYEVHINAHPHHMLDWDKDVSEQHPHVLDAINKLIPKDEEHRGGLQEFVANPDDYAGGAIIDYLHGAYGAKKTSEMLHSAGIKGIKYLDAGSRSDESKQTHNYVVFDHNDVRVRRKYEQGGAVDGYEDGGAVDDIPDIKNPISVFPKPQRMFPEENRPAGGQYLNAKTKEDMTGHKAAQASIGVQPGGRPFFNASADAVEQTGSHGKGNATAKTNLFKQKAGWKWVEAPEGHEDTGTIVSVEHRGHHHYALNAHFPKGVDLARYENSTSEPRLRPTTKGNVTKGDQVGTISVRGKEHPVYNHVIVKAGGGPIVKRALELLSKDRTGR
jgi:hypothetical protein